MKTVSLNIWGGREHEPLMRFLKMHDDIDVFCLQEVYDNAQGKDTIWHGANLNSLTDINYQCFYHPHLEDWWGLAMFVKKTILIEEVHEEFVHLHKRHNLEKEKLGHTAKNIQCVKVRLEGQEVSILNFHGLWNGKGKTDSEDRLQQSEKIVEIIKKTKGEIVFCGDFNLLPNTQSIQMIEDTGLRNLIREYNVQSTRTSLYTKPEKFADYIFVSKGIKVKGFQVLPDEVSDHAALLIDIG